LMTQLEIVGADVKVVATLEEIDRVGAQLRLVQGNCQQALDSIDWLQQLDVGLRMRLLEVAHEAGQLAVRCAMARDQYHDVEIGNTSVIARTTESLTGTLDGISGVAAANPILAGFRMVTSFGLTVGTAIAGGLFGAGSTQTESIRAAAQFAPRIFGTQSPQTMLQRLGMNLRSLGVATETANYVLPGTMRETRPASSVAEHWQRLTAAYHAPTSGVVVERYQIATGRQFVVYVPGTQSAGLGGVFPATAAKRHNPLDLRSNLNAMAAPGLAASELALSRALQVAGAGTKAGDRVLFVAHSQGALISANLASTPQPYRVSGLISVAGPISHLKLDGVPTLALEHTDDPVPALSGSRNPLTMDLVTVRAPSGLDGLIAAHSVVGYKEMANAVDASQDASLRTILDRIGPIDATSGTAQEFVLRRTSAGDIDPNNGGVICEPGRR
jgi:hypothetical protein